jgi:uncharacterized glyoxalase superfamily protein PhnB
MLIDHGYRRQRTAAGEPSVEGVNMSNDTIANIWPTFRYRDARAAIAFLRDAFGFEVAAEYTNAEDPNSVDHAELVWPGGGGVMLGSTRDEGVMTKTGVASGSVYIATDNVRELYHRAIDAGATEVMGLTEQDYGSLDFSVQDPEGVLWCFGTYRGARG